MILVLGAPDSGKSAIAEQIADELSGGEEKIYIATMIPCDQAGEERIRKHRRLREGKRFLTIEEPVHVADCVLKVAEHANRICLLECVSNLIGNVLHPRGEAVAADPVRFAVEEIRTLDSRVRELIVVSNDFPQMAEGYDADTVRYVNVSKAVNRELRAFSDNIREYREGEWISIENR